MVLCGNDAMFQRLCAALGHPEWAEDPLFATNDARVENKETLHTRIGDALQTADRDIWIARLEKANVPIAPIRDFHEVFAAPEVLDRDMVLDIPHPTAGSIKMPGSPIKLSETPIVRPAAPPLLGQHTEAILTDVLGLDAAAVAKLRADGVIA